MNDDTPSAAALLDRIDLARDDSQAVRTIISSILKAPDYHQFFLSLQGDATQPPPERAIKFVNALDKACVSLSKYLRLTQTLTQYTPSGAGI